MSPRNKPPSPCRPSISARRPQTRWKHGPQGRTASSRARPKGPTGSSGRVPRPSPKRVNAYQESVRAWGLRVLAPARATKISDLKPSTTQRAHRFFRQSSQTIAKAVERISGVCSSLGLESFGPSARDKDFRSEAEHDPKGPPVLPAEFPDHRQSG